MITRTRPLILCYHAVSSAWQTTLAVPERLIAHHLDILSRRGYQGLTFSEAERARQEDCLPARGVVVTFDDGFASVLRAKPILDAVGFPATVFVVTDFVSSGRPLCWPGIEWALAGDVDELRALGWPDLERLVEAGWEVGSHTASHACLPLLDVAAQRRELAGSRATIVARLGSCDTVAYPYGQADERVSIVAREAGYLAGCTLTAAHLVDQPLRRPRVGLYPRDAGLRARVKLSPFVSGLRTRRIARWADGLRRHRLIRRADRR